MISEREEPHRPGRKTKTRTNGNPGEKLAPKLFQKTVIQTLLQKESEKLNEVESEDDFEIPQFIGTVLDLAKKRLKEFPSVLLKKAEFVQYLYLEGNKLWTLPVTFFQCLSQLKWLDLRNNELVALPSAGLKGHKFLECLLLQGNRIKHLPTELEQNGSSHIRQNVRNYYSPFIKPQEQLPQPGLQPRNCHSQFGGAPVTIHRGNYCTVASSIITLFNIEPARDKYQRMAITGLRGALPSLKGLQITGNPITNVPYDVIADGFHKIVKHLRKLNSQEDILLPNSEAIVVKSSAAKEEYKSSKMNSLPPADDLEERTIPIGNGQRQESVDEQFARFSERGDMDKPFHAPFSSWNEAKKLLMKSKMCSKPKQRIIASCYRPSTKRRSRLGYKRKMITPAVLEEKARKDMQMAKRRETLEKQARKIQRMKDKEVLKAWRRQTEMNVEQLKLLDNYQHYPSRNFVMETPFDVDPEFLNMLSRSDLYRSLKELEAVQKRRKKNVPKLQITIGELEKQMREIKKKLESFHVHDDSGAHFSPRTKQSHLCKKMTQMQDIRKTLKNLHQRNLSITGVAAGTAAADVLASV